MGTLRAEARDRTHPLMPVTIAHVQPPSLKPSPSPESSANSRGPRALVAGQHIHVAQAWEGRASEPCQTLGFLLDVADGR